MNFSILVLTASAILLKQKGYIFRCIYRIHVGESVSDSVMFLRFDKDMKHCQYCQGLSSKSVVKVVVIASPRVFSASRGVFFMGRVDTSLLESVFNT